METNQMAADVKPQYWFPAKRYGYGWGLPATWQGWAVSLTWLVLVTVGAIILLPRHWVAFGVVQVVLTGLMIAICYAKGEPPCWRWGS